MARELTINSMVPLPRVNAAEAVALGEQLLTKAAAEQGAGLPLFIERPRARFAAALGALKAVIQPREAAAQWIRRAADRTADSAWRSFAGWLAAMVSMPEGSLAELPVLCSLNSTIFGNGLSFIILSHREEWTQSEARLKALEDSGYEDVVERVGGGPFLRNLKIAHTRYGEVLGITAPVQVEETQEVCERFLALVAAMKTYVAKVATYADPEEQGSHALSEALLLPLIQWKDTPARSDRAADSKSERRVEKARTPFDDSVN